jgi:hypothetical protein
VARKQFAIVPEATDIVGRGLRLAELNMGFDFSDLKLGHLVVGTPVVFIDERHSFFHSITGREPTGRFGDEETSDEYQGWGDNLKGEGWRIYQERIQQLESEHPRSLHAIVPFIKDVP